MQCGQRTWAVRCFLRELSDQQRRYEAISQHLKAARLDYTVGFDYIPRGIRIRGQWYPILKMEWVQGDSLNTYIEKHLNNLSALSDLAKRWVGMIETLQRACIAHGDLQHGNVLVANGNLRLIDYDGMYVPALAGQSSHEIGHSNYQHPLRTGSDFGPNMDDFSAWVIYVSLVVLSIDSRLWSCGNGGDECLLFRKVDFEQPHASNTLNQLLKHPDARVQSLVAIFQSLLYRELDNIPTLGGQSTTSPRTAQTNTAGSDWIKDHLPAATTTKTSAPATVNTVSAPSLPDEKSTWVLDFISPVNDPKSFTSKMLVPRLILALLVIVSVLICFSIPGSFFVSLPISMVIVICLVSIMLLFYYRQEATLVEKQSILAREHRQFSVLTSTEQVIQNNEKKKANLRADETKQGKTLQTKKIELERQEQHEQSNIQATLKKAIEALNIRRLRLNQQETAELLKVQTDIGSTISALDQQIGALDQARLEETSRTLKTKQGEYIHNYLQRYRIWDASIPGIGDGFKGRLHSSGFATAADVEYWRVQQIEGIGPNRASAIAAWRQSLETNAKSLMPARLTTADINQIDAKYQNQKLWLVMQRDNENRRLSSGENAIRSRYKLQRQPLDTEQMSTQTQANQEAKRITERYAKEYRSFSQSLAKLTTDTNEQCQKLDDIISQARKQLFNYHWELAKTRRELEAYRNITLHKYIRRLFRVNV
jgi:serine/threonine protein kinase